MSDETIIQQDLHSIIITETGVQVLDQTLLPNKIVYENITGVKAAWISIREMKVRGAPLISVVALHGLKMELLAQLQHLNDVDSVMKFIVGNAAYLKTSRATAVNLSNDLEALILHLETLQSLETKEFVAAILKFVEANFLSYEEACKKLSVKGADTIISHPTLNKKAKLSVLTICNTGKLATPGPGTALGIIRELHARGKLEKIYIPETRPYNQGSRLTATEVLHDGLPGVLIADSMAGWLMANEKVDLVVVGADRVTKNGSTANKIGTYTFAVLAHYHKIPLYVACPYSTIDEKITSGFHIEVEERPGNELKKIHDAWLAPKRIPTWNPSFDVTPPQLIEEIITENGNFAFDKTLHCWYQLNTEQLEAYLKKKLNLFEKDEKLEISDVADGNLNLVYRIKGRSCTLCVKQALPYVKCVGPQWLLSLKRALFEAESLKFENQIAPTLVPKFVHFDENLYILIMEFLEDHIILRKGLIQGQKYENIGKDIGLFVAKTCFFSSGLHLKADDLREKMSFWNENTLCTLTEQVIFLDPYIEAKFNRWTPSLEEEVKQIKVDQKLIVAVAKLRHKFISLKQALLHGDLHTGSVMVNDKGSHKVIDSEFAFYGPIGFDTGAFVSNLLMSYYSQRGHKNDKDYNEWILTQIIEFWNSFKLNWLELWNNSSNCKGDDYPYEMISKNQTLFKAVQEDYLQELWLDTLGFTGAKIIRRIVGIAHNADFETIEDVSLRADCEKRALKLAREMMVGAGNIETVEKLVDLARSYNI